MPRKKLDPRIGCGEDAPDWARPVNSLHELSQILGVSTYWLGKWKDETEEIQKGRPYHVGKCAFQLLATKKISIDELSQDAKMALAFDVAVDAFEYQAVSEVIDSLEVNVELGRLLAEEADDQTRLQNGLALLRSAFAPKSWAPLKQTQSLSIAIASPKTAALFRDRVWCLDSKTPSDIGFRIGSLEERIALGLMDSIVMSAADATNASDEKLRDVEQKLTSIDFETNFASMYESMMLGPLRSKTCQDVSVFSATQTACNEVYGPGDRLAAIAMLDGAPLIDEKLLTWEQVEEIRADPESRMKLRRFLHWLETDYANKPMSVVRHDDRI